MKHAALIIRPEYGTDPLELKLRDQGIPVYRHGVVSIQRESADASVIQQWFETDWQGIIVVSPIAAHEFHKQMSDKGWPKTDAFYAVGPGTADTLIDLTRHPAIWPAKGHNSESLLEISELNNVRGKNWLVITGKNGRTILADTLSKRGAHVSCAEIYSRKPLPAPDREQIDEWKQNVRIISVTSAEQTTLFLNQLWDQEKEWLNNCHWVVPSERVGQVLTSKGISESRVHYSGSAVPQSVAETIFDIKLSESGAMNTQKTSAKKTQSKQKTDSQPATSPQKPGKARSGFVYFLILVVAAGAGGAGWWLWQQQQALAAETSARIDSLREQTQQQPEQSFDRDAYTQEMTERLQQHVNSQLAQERSEYRQQLDRVARRASEGREGIQSLVDEQNRRIAQLSEQVRNTEARNSAHWHALEAFDLVTAAGHRLWFDYNKEGAKDLLSRAQAILTEAGNSAYGPVIRQIGNDIALIDDLPTVDTEGTARRLQRLQQQVRELTFVQGAAISPDAEEEISESISEWRRNLATAWDNFSSDVVRIQRTDDAPVNLNADQRSAILLSMELQLQIAQQALLRHQQEYFTSAMTQLVNTSQDFFDTETPTVRQFIAEAEQIAALSIEPVYPTRLLSHAMLRDLVDDVRDGRSSDRE